MIKTAVISASVTIGIAFAFMGTAQAQEVAIAAAPQQERCITIMSGFPDSGHLPRYQFFRLSEMMAAGSNTSFQSALAAYGEGIIADETPILDVVEDIANPVLRQAAPELAVSNMAHLINFARDCETYVSGQVASLLAFDADLALDDIIIGEDALYLRQVLSESLQRLGADTDPVHGPAVTAYAASLLSARDDLEFSAFQNDIEDLETLYLTDLDGRLARSNDLINEEINRETLGDAVLLSNDISENQRKKDKQNDVYTLLRILTRY